MTQCLKYSTILLTIISQITLIKGERPGGVFAVLPKENEVPSNAVVLITPNEKTVELDEFSSFSIHLSGKLTECVNLTIVSDPTHQKKITEVPEESYSLCPGTINYTFYVYKYETLEEGIVTISIEADPEYAIDTEDAYIVIAVMLSPIIDIVSAICGWIYTIAWDISFLPQIIHNWRRKSVVGLSFDYITFNFLGFFCYFVFNAGLLWIPEIQDQFREENPNTVLHVQINDVIFPFYALLCTSVVIIQCFLYERKDQRVSRPCLIISSLLITSAIIYLILVFEMDDVLWIDLLYWLSYIKLFITCIKYAPQLYLNYERKSTEGWSIWNVFLDFSGGLFSLIQMFLIAGNYDDWRSLLVDPTKLGLGLLSIFFNILFFIQHYGLYRNAEMEEKIEKEIEPVDELR